MASGRPTGYAGQQQIEARRDLAPGHCLDGPLTHQAIGMRSWRRMSAGVTALQELQPTLE